MAGDDGFEPPPTDPESAVLPLDESPTASKIIASNLSGRQALSGFLLVEATLSVPTIDYLANAFVSQVIYTHQFVNGVPSQIAMTNLPIAS